ncbi:MAG: AMP-binding protein, partial [Scytonema sp. CRU_2_7]|nr:AMP-binding protein [Scytonema sp. CRU_2_7]
MDISKEEIIAQRSMLSAKRRLLLEKRLQGKIETNSRLKIIPRRSNANPVPLSFAQKRLWFLAQLEHDSSYNEPKVLRLQGSLNVAALQQSFNEIVRRHEVLRTTFAIVQEQPVQVIAPTLNLIIPVIDLQEFPSDEREAEVRRLANESAQQPFDLAKDPLLRVSLLQLGETEYVLLLIVHHIVFDHLTLGIFIKELTVLYKAFSKGEPSPMSELPIQYADFAVWQQQWLQGEKLEVQLSYWKQQLNGAPAALDLPTDHPRPAIWSNQGARQSLVMPKYLTDALNALSQQQQATLFMTLLAALNTLLYRYTNQEDILVGTTISDRNRAELEDLIGFFINTQVMRTDLSGNPPFKMLLQRVREVALRAYEHRDLPFEKLVDELNIERNLSQNPLFQVAFVLEHNNTTQSLELPGLTLRPLEIYSGTAKFDLTLFIADTKQGLIATLEYSTELFNAATITRMLRHFQTLLEGIVADPNQRLSNLPLLTEAERQTLLVDWNNTQTDYPQEQCIHQLFEAQVERTPDAVAVVFEDQQLTYQELNANANQLAHYLQNLGVEPEVLVGICVERSLLMVIGLLAILKAGGAYVPLDPTYPKERLAFMLENSQPSVLLTQQHLVESLPNHKAKIVCLDSNWELIAQQSIKNPGSNITCDNLAYVIYTSGSTGRPKGAMNTHQAICNRLVW